MCKAYFRCFPLLFTLIKIQPLEVINNTNMLFIFKQKILNFFSLLHNIEKFFANCDMRSVIFVKKKEEHTVKNLTYDKIKIMGIN